MKSSQDVWFIAFLQNKGVKIAKYDVISKGKVRCYFELTEEQWQSYKLEFNNSEISVYKGLIEKIKDLCY